MRAAVRLDIHMTTSEATYYRTGKGSHYHADHHCANFRRSIHTGDPIPVTAVEAATQGLTACAACVPGTPAPVTAAAAPAKDYCPGSGQSFAHPKRMYDDCPACGKRLRARGPVSKPQAVR
jgi:hypothetical protein